MLALLLISSSYSTTDVPGTVTLKAAEEFLKTTMRSASTVWALICRVQRKDQAMPKDCKPIMIHIIRLLYILRPACFTK